MGRGMVDQTSLRTRIGMPVLLFLGSEVKITQCQRLTIPEQPPMECIP